ncbi:nuclear matrix constituent protein 1a isoform X2 [Quercus suber]
MSSKASDRGDHSFRSPRNLFSKSRKQVSDSQSSSSSSGLRRSRSLSSGALSERLGQTDLFCVNDQSRSPSSSASSGRHQQCDHSSRRRAYTPERQYKAKRFEEPAIQNARGFERPGSAGSSRTYNDSSSICSSNISSKVVDRYIDGEQQQEKSRINNSSSQRNYNGNAGRLPPRVQYTAPTSPTDSSNDKPRACSFREAKSSRLRFSSKDWTERGFGHESPRRLAKNVVERLSQSNVFPKTSSKPFDLDVPITIEDIYGRPLDRCFNANSDVVAEKIYPLDEPYETVNGYREEVNSGFLGQNLFHSGKSEDVNSDEIEDDTDAGLGIRSKEAEQRVMLLSEELEQESFLRDCGFDVSMLIQKIRDLTEDRISLSLEVSNLLQSQIAERASAREELRWAKEELEARTRRLEKEKNELQSGLEKELDRRSSDWSFKLEKYQSEEQRLRERVRELAEHNVSLQREVSSFDERERESKSIITNSGEQLHDLTTSVEELKVDNEDLRQNLSELQEKYRAAEEDRECIHKNFEEKDKECKELHKSITRLLRTCSEQEKTIDGLREGFSEKLGEDQTVEKFDKHMAKLQMEQMRLTGVELALRRELESCRLEVDSLRHENIYLLNRLKGNGKENFALTFKLDKEMWTRLCCLQNQGLLMLNESTDLCSKLLEFIKGKAGQFLPDAKHGLEVIKNGLGAQFVVEAEVKLQGFKRGTENLTRSLQMMSTLLHEKSTPGASKLQSQCTDADGLVQQNDQTSEDVIRSELKAETLLTSLLREKLYSKELEVEQLQAELATAVRGNDILRCEVQNALDNLSCVTHNLKDLELQMMRKDENLNQLESNLQESLKELTIMRGILPKVSDERDLMWEEVKQYNEKNMLLNSEVNVLRKKIEALDEDVLLKEGQITILKDSLRKKPFDLLASPDSLQDFLLE